MKPHVLRVAALAVLLCAAPLHAQLKPAAKPAGTIAKVNGVTISNDMAELLAAEQAPNQPLSEELRSQIRTHLIQREVLLQAARKGGLDKQSATRLRMEIARDGVLVSTYIDNWARTNPVSDAKVRSEYDRLVKEAGDTEYKLSHVQTKTEEAAAAVIKKLQAGAKFADIAKETSIDEGSREVGGDLGWVRQGTFNDAPEVATAIAKLEKGKFTAQPQKSRGGYHVFLLEDVRKASNPSYEEAKPRIMQSLQEQAVQEHIADLVKKAKVE